MSRKHHLRGRRREGHWGQRMLHQLWCDRAKGLAFQDWKQRNCGSTQREAQEDWQGRQKGPKGNDCMPSRGFTVPCGWWRRTVWAGGVLVELRSRKLFLAARKLLLAASRDGNRKMGKGGGHRPREYELWGHDTGRRDTNYLGDRWDVRRWSQACKMITGLLDCWLGTQTDHGFIFEKNRKRR